ncbi:MAG: 3-phosphoserine/phosphohydroxythreonine transaminase [Clostridiales Family XIII bacterium]|jgi:phosphoserine aminotransferase|nr:3-phosphoserine/phosphohydroxythreonine transaminase [Clostridiales Family XIII bacterium]
MGERVYNFSAGPSMLPVEVMKRAAGGMLDYEGSGMSVMEMSHRSKPFEKIIQDAEANLRTLLGIPDGYDVLFVQGGATLVFAMIPLNLMTGSGKADFLITGQWAEKAYKEAAKFGDARAAASSKGQNFSFIPKVPADEFRADADYVHITWNNTIYGTKYPAVPDTKGLTLVTDMSSSILSEEVDVSKFGCIYAGAQKNIGPAGLSIIIIKKELVGRAKADIPTYLDLKVHADNGSLYNTPPAWCIYIAGEVFKYLLEGGGIGAIEQVNKRKAGKLYGYIDGSRLYMAPSAKEDRSLMNVVFVTGDEGLDKKFVAEAKGEGLVQLNGHRSIGGMRASIYNAMPEEGVDKLIDFMKRFEAANA